jgi:glucan biosynthesis protein
VVEIEAVLYFREPDLVHAVDAQHKPLATIGLAPLTSMFWFGENSERKFDDYRPEVHDSDGLLIHTEGGERLWRPLDNGPAMRHQKFSAKHTGGFGLLQRDRNFSSYEDLFNPYQSVPSVWVEPHGASWDDGDIHLVELTTHYEGMDNIVAFWSPAVKPRPLQPYHFAYSLYWTLETDMSLLDQQSGVHARRSGPAATPGAANLLLILIFQASPRRRTRPSRTPVAAKTPRWPDTHLFGTGRSQNVAGHTENAANRRLGTRTRWTCAAP